MLRNKEIKALVLFLSAVGISSAAVLFWLEFLAGILFVVAFALICAAFYVFTRNRYKSISRLNTELNRVTNGDFSMEVCDNTEGELSILQAEIYKLVSMLTEQTKFLERDRNILADYLSDISHQLKTPLAALQIMSELLESKDLPPEKRDEFIGNIKTGLARMEWLTLSLLKMAKLDANAVLLNSDSDGEEIGKGVNIDEIITLSLQMLEVFIASKKQRVMLSGSNSIFIHCDLNWTVEALSNIIKNASEHSPENGVIKVSWNENPLAVIISVEDSGTGIDQKDLPYLFRRFYKGTGAAKESTGIGLALSLAIMRKQNGDIEVKNIVGAGSMFSLKFYKL